MIEGKQAICGCEGTYTYTHPFLQMPLQMFTCVISLSMQTRFLEHLLWQQALRSSPKTLRKLYENSLKAGSPKALLKLSKSSPKANWLSLKALRKHNDFLWKLSESRMTFVESSKKAGWLLLRALQKQDDFCWVLYEKRMTFVESSTKAGWLSLRALRKQDDFNWELLESLSKSA